MKHPHPLMSRKFLAGAGTAILLFVGALVVSAANFGSLAMALVGLYTAFAGTNTVAGLVAPKADKPDVPDAEAS